MEVCGPNLATSVNGEVTRLDVDSIEGGLVAADTIGCLLVDLPSLYAELCSGIEGWCFLSLPCSADWLRLKMECELMRESRSLEVTSCLLWPRVDP